MMIEAFLRAVFNMGIPVAVISWLLVWWALKQNFLGPVSVVDDVEKGFSRLSKSKSGKKKNKSGLGEEDSPPARKLNPVHDKWLAFGGGFYGVVALFTYMKVELAEIAGFIERYDGLFGLISSLSIGLLVELFIDAMMNFVVAISWPVYWLGEAAGPHMWVWFVVAYGAYWLGARLALVHFQKRQEP